MTVFGSTTCHATKCIFAARSRYAMACLASFSIVRNLATWKGGQVVKRGHSSRFALDEGPRGSGFIAPSAPGSARYCGSHLAERNAPQVEPMGSLQIKVISLPGL